MIKKTVSIVLCLMIVFVSASCGAKESSQISYEETSAVTTTELTTQTETESAEVTAAETEKITQAEKVYLDATDEDYLFLARIYEDIACCNFWDDGFDCENSSFAYNIPFIKEMIHISFGEEDYYKYSGIPRGFNGLIYYDTFSDLRVERGDFDPLFKFSEVDFYEERRTLYNMSYFSINANAVEWVVTELLGGKVDRQNVVTNKDSMISCYYCDGRYYFQDPGEYGGAGFELTFTKKMQQTDGSYVLDFNTTWSGTGRTTVGLIEKDGVRYWKIFNLDWDR